MNNRTKEKELEDLYTLFLMLRQMSNDNFDYYTSRYYPLPQSQTNIAKVCATIAIQLKNRVLEDEPWARTELYNKLHEYLFRLEERIPAATSLTREQFLRKFIAELYEKNPFAKLNLNTITHTDLEAFHLRWSLFKPTTPPQILSQEEIRSLRINNENERKHNRLDNALASFKQAAITELEKYRSAGRRNWLGRLFDMDPANKKIADSLHAAIDTITNNKQQNVAQKFMAINTLLYEKSSELQTKNSKRLLPIIISIQKQLMQQVKKTSDKLTIQTVWQQNENLKMRHPKYKK